MATALALTVSLKMASGRDAGPAAGTAAQLRRGMALMKARNRIGADPAQAIPSHNPIHMDAAAQWLSIKVAIMAADITAVVK
jgi:hypothetical protein